MRNKFLLFALLFLAIHFLTIDFATSHHNNGTAPFMGVQIEHLYVETGGELTIDLDIYFDDNEEQALSYRVNESRVNNLEISFDKGYMTIKLGDNFSNHETFRILVSDGDSDTGDHEITSEEVYVFERKIEVSENVSVSSSEDNEGNESNASVVFEESNEIKIEEDSSVDETSEAAPKETVRSTDESGGSLFRIFDVMLLVVLVICVILVIFYTFFRKKKDLSVNSEKKAPLQ